jgi:hypothetical protein
MDISIIKVRKEKNRTLIIMIVVIHADHNLPAGRQVSVPFSVKAILLQIK